MARYRQLMVLEARDGTIEVSDISDQYYDPETLREQVISQVAWDPQDEGSEGDKVEAVLTWDDDGWFIITREEVTQLEQNIRDERMQPAQP